MHDFVIFFQQLAHHPSFFDIDDCVPGAAPAAGQLRVGEPRPSEGCPLTALALEYDHLRAPAVDPTVLYLFNVVVRYPWNFTTRFGTFDNLHPRFPIPFPTVFHDRLHPTLGRAVEHRTSGGKWRG